MTSLIGGRRSGLSPTRSRSSACGAPDRAPVEDAPSHCAWLTPPVFRVAELERRNAGFGRLHRRRSRRKLNSCELDLPTRAAGVAPRTTGVACWIGHDSARSLSSGVLIGAWSRRRCVPRSVVPTGRVGREPASSPRASRCWIRPAAQKSARVGNETRATPRGKTSLSGQAAARRQGSCSINPAAGASYRRLSSSRAKGGATRRSIPGAIPLLH